MTEMASDTTGFSRRHFLKGVVVGGTLVATGEAFAGESLSGRVTAKGRQMAGVVVTDGRACVETDDGDCCFRAPVPVVHAAMREFLDRPRWQRVGLLQDPDFRARARAAGSLPKPFEIAVPDAAEGTELVLSRVADGRVVRTVPVRAGVAKVDNLEVACAYSWQLRKGGKLRSGGSFVTEDGVPRVCRIDGIGNVRDLGGGMTVGGRRIRQGLLYRSAAMNTTASTPKDKPKEQWRPGRSLLTPDAVRDALDTFGFRTDLDLRTEPECYGMKESPLGKSVAWTLLPSSEYSNMSTDKARAAFAKAFRLVSDPKNLPLVFHCAGGADRTGTLAWLLCGILGEPEEKLYRDWELTVFNYDALKFNHWNYLKGFVDLLEKDAAKLSPQERCVAYAKACGISDAEIEAFRNLMTESEKGTD